MTRRRAVTVLLLACVATALVAGIAGGLLRVGVIVPGAADAAWPARAALAHAALMMGGFMGTVIGIERAVAARRVLAWTAPAAAGAAALCLLAGAVVPAGWLLVAASLAFAAVNVHLWQRQQAAHTGLLVASAVAWLAGNLLFAWQGTTAAVLAWWFAFLVTTIAAERLEMTRLMRRRPGAQPALFAILAAMAGGAALTTFAPAAGGVLFGAALLALAGWLFAFDIARRTVRAHGLSRYMALCLLTGYAWLATGGVAWAATALRLPARDGALHALGLGFIVSMVMGHAPVILPAIARVKLEFGRFFYLPLAILHLSLLARLAGGFFQFTWKRDGALLNVLALVLFAATMAGAALAWRHRHPARD